MQYKLKSENGKVKALLRTGKDFVADTLTVSAAQHIIDSNSVVESDKEGYPIRAGEWYFEGEAIEEKKPVEKVETSSTYGTFGKNRGKK